MTIGPATVLEVVGDHIRVTSLADLVQSSTAPQGDTMQRALHNVVRSTAYGEWTVVVSPHIQGQTMRLVAPASLGRTAGDTEEITPADLVVGDREIRFTRPVDALAALLSNTDVATLPIMGITPMALATTFSADRPYAVVNITETPHLVTTQTCLVDGEAVTQHTVRETADKSDVATFDRWLRTVCVRLLSQRLAVIVAVGCHDVSPTLTANLDKMLSGGQPISTTRPVWLLADSYAVARGARLVPAAA